MNRTYAVTLFGAVLLALPVFYLLGTNTHQPTALRAVAESVLLSATTTTPVPLQMLFTGDLMLDRGVAKHAVVKGDDALFEGVRDIFAGMDAVVPNLEGTITTLPSVSERDHTDLRFTFNPHYASYLKTLGVQVVSLSNNHTDDFGDTGYLSTKTYLDSAGIASFGSPANDRDFATEITLNNTRVCFIGYEGFIHTDPAPIATLVAEMRPRCDYFVATMHAGEEYQPTFTTLQKTAAHAFIDAGVDVVIGTHPHVVEPLELYKGKPIFYSLGNFLFDQDFSWATMHGLTVRVSRTKDATTYTLIPVTIAGEETIVTTNEPDIDRTILSTITSLLPTDIAKEIVDNHSFSVK